MAAIALSALVIGGMYLLSPWNTPEPPTVDVMRPTVGDVADGVSLRGQVVEQRRQELFAKGLSIVEQVYVEPGQTVGRNARLMRLRLVDDAEARSAARYADLQSFSQSVASAEPEQIEAALSALLPAEDSSVQRDSKVYYLYSEFSGTVMDVAVKKGDSVSSVFPCLSVSDLSSLCVRASAEEADVKRLRTGQDCIVSVPALLEEAAAGRVLSVSPYAAASRTLLGESTKETEVLVSLGADSALRPGYSATVRVVTDVSRAALLVPYAAILQDDDGSEYVMVLSQGYVLRRDITTRYELDDCAEVVAGLTGSEWIILDAEGLEHGQRAVGHALF